MFALNKSDYDSHDLAKHIIIFIHSLQAQGVVADCSYLSQLRNRDLILPDLQIHSYVQRISAPGKNGVAFQLVSRWIFGVAL